MKVDTVQSPSFRNNKFIMSQESKKNLQKLLYKMNHETKYSQNANGTSFISNIMSGLNILFDEAIFTDARYLCAPTEREIQSPTPDCRMEFGRNIVHINSYTGEIFPIRKSFFKTGKKVAKDTCNYIKFALENYDNSNLISKVSFSIKGFTKKGIELLKMQS